MHFSKEEVHEPTLMRLTAALSRQFAHGYAGIENATAQGCINIVDEGDDHPEK